MAEVNKIKNTKVVKATRHALPLDETSSIITSSIVQLIYRKTLRFLGVRCAHAQCVEWSALG